MKKKQYILFFSICIVMILLFSLSLYGEEESHTHSTPIRTEQEFLQMQENGSYYLENDLTVSETLFINTEISLCLNGKVLKYQNNEQNGSIFYILNDGVLNIYDCSEESHTCEATDSGQWILSNDISDKDSLKNVVGGLIIGGTGETREIENLNASYLCGGFAYIQGGVIRIYGGTIVGNTADFGGAVYLTENANLEIHGGKICGNVSNYRGGAVFAQKGTVLINNGIISENQANKNGGGIDISGDSKLIMNGGRITSNHANEWSGGIENFGTFELYGGTISGNIAAEDGGGVYNGGTLIMRGGTVGENIAKYGAGICNDQLFILYDGNIRDNLAQESGGGIYNAHTTEMYGGNVYGNTARTSGGGIENDGTFNMYDGLIGGTEAAKANAAYLGGGICLYSGTFTMRGGKIIKNTGVDGGGVENEASFIMTGGVITENFASMQGGGISNRGELILKGNAEIVRNGSGTNEPNEHKGGGVYWLASEKSSARLEGAVQITNNTTNGESANFVIYGNGKISISSLSDAACIGLTLLDKDKKDTSGTVLQYAGNENEDIQKLSSCFSSDQSFYVIKTRGNEASLTEKNMNLTIGLLLGIFIVLAASFIIGMILVRKNKGKSAVYPPKSKK